MRRAHELSEPPITESSSLGRKDLLIFFGLLLLVFCVYGLSGPGRIDIIDGQFRFDVARSLLDGDGFQVRDPALPRTVRGLDGNFYAFYGPGASLLGVPLVALARMLGGDQNAEMFFFSFTSAAVTSICAAVFYLFQRRLGAGTPASVLWTLVLVLATPLWSLGTTVFDQGQHATLLLIAVFFGWQSAARRSRVFAVLAGLVAGSLVLFQEGLVLLLPFVGLSTLEGAAVKDPTTGKFSFPLGVRVVVHRYLPFALGCVLPIVGWMFFNFSRFGSPFDSGKSHVAGHPPLWGNPALGLLGLLFSPGKSVLLFFPTIGVGLFYLRRCLPRFPMLTLSIVLIAATQLTFTSCLTFWGSDWAWGPRYLFTLAPLLTLPLGFASIAGIAEKRILLLAISLGFVVQLLGIGAEHHRFFFEHRLSDFFWYFQPETYWQESQLFSRPSEIVSILTEPVPTAATLFRPGPYAALWPTYCIFGGPSGSSDIWMRMFSVFYLPRPWPLWMPTLSEALQPVSPLAAALVFLALGGIGSLLVALGLRPQARSVTERSQG
jgi:hypothetical protein